MTVLATTALEAMTRSYWHAAQGAAFNADAMRALMVLAVETPDPLRQRVQAAAKGHMAAVAKRGFMHFASGAAATPSIKRATVFIMDEIAEGEGDAHG